MVAGLYTALLGIWLIVLSMRVIALRGNPVFNWFAFGYAGEEALPRAIRGHGNLTEYAPIFLILMLVAELSTFQGNGSSLHWYGAAFVIGRIMHGICFGFMKWNIFLRVGGTVLTLFPILGLSTALLVQYF